MYNLYVYVYTHTFYYGTLFLKKKKGNRPVYMEGNKLFKSALKNSAAIGRFKDSFN